MNVFIAGPRKISILNKEIEERLQNIKENEFTVLVGDANGVDKAVQKFFSESCYHKVKVFAVNGVARNNLGKWSVEPVVVKSKTKDFMYYTVKDIEMAKNADYGFMIWNGQSKGTLNNMINLTKMHKKVLIYFLPEKKYYTVRSFEDLTMFMARCDEKTNETFKDLLNNYHEEHEASSFQPTLNFESL